MRNYRVHEYNVLFVNIKDRTAYPIYNEIKHTG